MEAEPKQSMDEVHRLIRLAVQERQPVEAWYGGLRRLFCPHVLGRNETRDLLVFCYQYAGESRSQPGPQQSVGVWRCFRLNRLRRVQVIEGPWRTEPHAAQRCVERIEVSAGF